jgi:hypothetical protein
MGVKGGIWASTMKMVRAMAVSMERVVSFLVFMVFTAFQ